MFHNKIYSKHAGWLPIFVAVALFGIAVPAVLLIWLACTPLVAIQRGDLGAFVSATTSAGGFVSPAYTSIQTTVGTVAVEGAVSAARGQKLSIDMLNKIGVRLCVDDDLQTCMPLASPWLGSLKPTSQATTTIDFQRVDLTPENMIGSSTAASSWIYWANPFVGRKAAAVSRPPVPGSVLPSMGSELATLGSGVAKLVNRLGDIGKLAGVLQLPHLRYVVKLYALLYDYLTWQSAGSEASHG